MPPVGAHEQQVRDIRARHEENEEGRRRNHPQRLRDVADHVLAQWNQPRHRFRLIEQHLHWNPRRDHRRNLDAARQQRRKLALRRGDLTAAARHAAAGRAIPGPHSAEMYARAAAALVHAQVSEVTDGPAAAMRHLRRFSAVLDTHPGLLLGDPATAPWLTRTALAAGDAELAARAARAAAAIASGSAGCPAIDAAAAHSFGLAHQDNARLGDAAERHPDPWARASAAEDLGVSHAHKGDAAAAVRQFTEATQGYQAAGAAADMARVRRRLRALGVRHRHWAPSGEKPSTGWGSLTEAEHAAAELVAQGLSNREVAGRMYVSAHTVAFYLRQIFRKLDIGSRVELTCIVLQRKSLT